MFELYFTESSLDHDQPLTVDGASINAKYTVSDRILTVNNVSITDEGFYYCRRRRNGVLETEQLPGACLYAYSKSNYYGMNSYMLDVRREFCGCWRRVCSSGHLLLLPRVTFEVVFFPSTA